MRYFTWKELRLSACVFMLVGAYAGLYGWCTFTDGLPAHVKDNKAGTHFVPATPPGQPLARVGMMAGIAIFSAGAIIFVVATIIGKNSNKSKEAIASSAAEPAQPHR